MGYFGEERVPPKIELDEDLLLEIREPGWGWVASIIGLVLILVFVWTGFCG